MIKSAPILCALCAFARGFCFAMLKYGLKRDRAAEENVAVEPEEADGA